MPLSPTPASRGKRNAVSTSGTLTNFSFIVGAQIRYLLSNLNKKNQKMSMNEIRQVSRPNSNSFITSKDTRIVWRRSRSLRPSCPFELM
jgi:hypothetical protein